MNIRGLCLFTHDGAQVGCGLYRLDRFNGELIWWNIPCAECWVSPDFPQDYLKKTIEKATELGYVIFRREYSRFIKTNSPLSVPALYDYKEGDL